MLMQEKRLFHGVDLDLDKSDEQDSSDCHYQGRNQHDHSTEHQDHGGVDRIADSAVRTGAKENGCFGVVDSHPP